MKRLHSALLIIAIALALLSALLPATTAKTLESARAENIFLYAVNDEGKDVLIKIMSLDDLKAISHGQPDGRNFFISTTDNYPTTQYCEARGITVPGLVEYARGVTTVTGASLLRFSGSDVIRLMATDSFGHYNRSWTYDELYGVSRYYFEGLYDRESGWNEGWEVDGGDGPGRTIDEYNDQFKDADRYYENKRAVFAAGIESVPILATESFSGRTTTDPLIASTEPAIAEFIAANNGVAAGSLRDALEDTWSLRLSLPMTEADLMFARRTAFDNFKWIYNLKLEMAAPPAIRSLGTVAEPVATASLSGGTLTIAVSCETPGARIFYSFDGAPQIPYTAPITVDVNGRNLASDPVVFYMTAVREGWDDAGIVTSGYPGGPPAFKTMHSATASRPVVFEAADAVSQESWDAWAEAITFVTMKAPSADGYTRIDAGNISIDGRSIAFDAGLFDETGSFSFIFHAAGYSDKSASLTIRRPAPEISPPQYSKTGMPLTFRFDDDEFQNGVSLHVYPPGSDGVMISNSFLDRSAPGRVTLRAAYFDSQSSVIREPGEYRFSFVNSRYEPGTVEVQLTIDNGQLTVWDDVAGDAWYFDAVRYVSGLSLFDDIDGGFAPDTPMTRAMLAEALYRLEGVRGERKEDSGEMRGFDDVAQGDHYHDAVMWASSAGIVLGYDDNTFRPDQSITREQIATMLYRYASAAPLSGDEANGLSLFTDSDRVSGYALESLAWANGMGIINGMGDGTIEPQGTAVRAQVAQMLLNWKG